MVEQRTHKPLVAGSIPASGTNLVTGLNESMAVVCILRGSSGRHYIGMTNDLERRLDEHRAGHTHTTKRLGGELTLVASRVYASRDAAAEMERRLKSWKNPARGGAFLSAPA